jgi:LysM repeat protein
MNDFRQVSMGILASLLSIAIIFGSLTMSFMEVRPEIPVLVMTTEQIVSPTSSNQTVVVETPVAVLVTETPVAPASTTAPSAIVCVPPPGWTAIYIVQPGDTLQSIAETYGTTTKALMNANCLVTKVLYPDTQLYVPYLAPTATKIPCGPPFGWVIYIVQPGDTLYSIAQAFGTTVTALQQANCLGSSTLIRAGQRLYVPYRATSTPPPPPTDLPTNTPTLIWTPTWPPSFTFTPTLLPSATATATPTLTPVVITETPTFTPTPLITDTPLPTFTDTPLPTVTEFPTPTLTLPPALPVTRTPPPSPD